MKKSSSSPILFLLIFFLHSAFFKVAPHPETPADLLMSPQVKVESMPQYQKILKTPENLREKVKIEYLIARVRKSPYTFIRNGDSFGGGRAAIHLIWKFGRKADRVKTARDFIEFIASGSSMTGQPYQVKVSDGTFYPVKDLLTNDLRVLEEHLQSVQAPS